MMNLNSTARAARRAGAANFLSVSEKAIALFDTIIMLILLAGGIGLIAPANAVHE
jgi:hypothetical protein